MKNLGLGLFLFSISIPFLLNQHQRKPASTPTEDRTAYGWKLTFADEFDSADQAIAKGADPKCFSMKPQCSVEFEWDTSVCDEKYHAQLKDLNKCNWKVYDTYNWMDFSATQEQAVNAFNPSHVRVENGNLILSADRSPIAKGQLNCKKSYKDSRFGFEALTRDCAIYSGGVSSFQRKLWGSDEILGFAQAYGRFEVRAKLPRGQGSWPAIWMMPQEASKETFPESGKDCGWPYIGEIDLMEQWSDNFNKVASGYIHGYCNRKLDVREGFDAKLERTDQNFYVYGLEWDQNYICFFQNDRYSGCIYKDDLLRAKDLVENKRVGKEKAWIVHYPFYWILNLTIEPGLKKGKLKVDPDTFGHQEMVIDYVRVYERCSSTDPKESCKQFKLEGDYGINGYNSDRGETATATINAYPNPMPRSHQGGNANYSLRLDQDCENVTVDLIDLNGQNVSKMAGSDLEHLFQGSLAKDQVIEKTFNVAHLSNGLYLVRSEYGHCGTDRSGRGNQVAKVIITDGKERNRITNETGGFISSEDFQVERKKMTRPNWKK